MQYSPKVGKSGSRKDEQDKVFASGLSDF